MYDARVGYTPFPKQWGTTASGLPLLMAPAGMMTTRNGCGVHHHLMRLTRVALVWSSIKAQHDEGHQDWESPRGKSSSWRVSKRSSENLREVLFFDLVFITSVPLGDFRRSHVWCHSSGTGPIEIGIMRRKSWQNNVNFTSCKSPRTSSIIVSRQMVSITRQHQTLLRKCPFGLHNLMHQKQLLRYVLACVTTINILARSASRAGAMREKLINALILVQGQAWCLSLKSRKDGLKDFSCHVGC